MEKPRKNTVWIVILIIAGLIGSFVVGGLAGGAAGWALGRRAMTRETGAMERTIPDRVEEAVPPVPEGLPDLREWFVSGALITTVIADSPADRAGLREGDMITSVDGLTLDDADALAEMVAKRAPGDEILLTIARMGRRQNERQVSVTLESTSENGREEAWLGIEYTYISVE